MILGNFMNQKCSNNKLEIWDKTNEQKLLLVFLRF